MSRMINSLNSTQRINSNKYTMALESAQTEDTQEQHEFPGLAEESKDRSTTSADNNPIGSAAAVFPVKNSLAVPALVLGILLALTLSVKAFSAVYGDKNQTVKLAQIVAKQNREIRNLESTMARLQTEQKAEVDRVAKDLRLLGKQVTQNDKDFSEMVMDVNMTRSMIDEMKTTQQQIMSKIVNVSKDIELIKSRP